MGKPSRIPLMFASEDAYSCAVARKGLKKPAEAGFFVGAEPSVT